MVAHHEIAIFRHLIRELEVALAQREFIDVSTDAISSSGPIQSGDFKIFPSSRIGNVAPGGSFCMFAR